MWQTCLKNIALTFLIICMRFIIEVEKFFNFITVRFIKTRSIKCFLWNFVDKNTVTIGFIVKLFAIEIRNINSWHHWINQGRQLIKILPDTIIQKWCFWPFYVLIRHWQHQLAGIWILFMDFFKKVTPKFRQNGQNHQKTITLFRLLVKKFHRVGFGSGQSWPEPTRAQRQMRF